MAPSPPGARSAGLRSPKPQASLTSSGAESLRSSEAPALAHGPGRRAGSPVGTHGRIREGSARPRGSGRELRARARAVPSAATAPGPSGRRRGNTALRRSGRASRPTLGRERAEPRSVSAAGGEGPRARPGRVAMGTRRALTAATAALSPGERQRPRTAAPHLWPRGHGAANQEPRTARAADWRRRPGQRARTPPHLEAVGARGRARAEATDGRLRSHVAALTPPPRAHGWSANPAHAQAAPGPRSREGNMAAALRYRRLYWRLQQRHQRSCHLTAPAGPGGHTDSRGHQALALFVLRLQPVGQGRELSSSEHGSGASVVAGSEMLCVLHSLIVPAATESFTFL